MAKATLDKRLVEAAKVIPAVYEKTVTLTLTENEAAGLAGITGRMQSQEDHPNSLYKTYQALHGVIPYSKRPRVVVGDYGSIHFAD